MLPNPTSKTGKRQLSYDLRILVMALLVGLPGGLVALLLLWTGDYGSKTRWTLALLIVSFWWGLALALRERVIRPLQTLSNLLAALREGDYSLRARAWRGEDTLAEVMVEANALGEVFRDQRLGALEATTLLRKVIQEIDVAVFAFDGEHRLRLINRAGEELLAQPVERLMGLTAEELGLADCLQGEPTHTLQRKFPGAPSGSLRWGISRSTFRERGLPHYLLVLSDLSQALREEERLAWQRLVRVLGHELNNSLTPINSMAGSLAGLLNREPRPTDWEDDMKRGLRVIAARSEALSRFMGAYARLARLPKPRLQSLDVGPWVRRVAGLETRLGVTLCPGPEISIQADGDQLEQLLINLLRNGVDAALETKGGVEVGWRKNATHLEVWVKDEGLGLSNTANLFVPFFTTKPGGSGIGLALSRQIAESHGGTLTLENRRDAPGCEARLRLPLA
ncbi:MAG TPA: ATP-binding protein [Terriglobia bacterium]|jgi:two-component system nitrogen regulation sensor histidine kinase NtrY|nr:ATP-binding protein [Terriglobia bacterium]